MKKEMRIGDFLTITRGASPRPISKYVTSDDNGINWIKIGDVDPNSFYITKTEEKITEEGAKKSRYVKEGDFILSNSMSFGRPYILKINGCVHDGWLILSDYDKTVIPSYLYYLLRSPTVQSQFDGSANGSTVRNLNSDLVRNVVVNIHTDKTEQQSISSQLDTIQKAIDTKTSELSLLDEAVKSEFVEMFGENPVESSKWKVAKWADKVRITNGRDYKKLVVKTGLYPVYGSGGDMGIRVDDYLCSENTVIIGRKGNIDKPIFVKEKFWNVDTAFGLNVDESEINPYYFFEHSKKYNYRSMDTGVTIPSLTKTALFELKLAIPPLDLQNQFAAFVQQIDKSKFVLHQQLQFTEKYAIMFKEIK